MNLDLVDNIEFDGINYKDYPDFCDLFCSNADYNGIPMTEKQLDELNDEHWDFVYETFLNNLF